MFESLESRKLFAATLSDASPLTDTTTDMSASLSLNFPKITYNKVAMQDFHFTKVTMQDFHFVTRVNKASPS